MSISDIATQTGLKRTAIWKSLKSKNAHLRPQKPVPFARWRERPGKSGARPPYGYCYLQGEVVKHPDEYPTLLLIHNLWKQGARISSIVLALEGRGHKSRTGKSWSYNVVKAILKRFETRVVVPDEPTKNPRPSLKKRTRGKI